ncbi:MAG: dihydrolipoyl dehydrogenase family protein [Ilumatobacteraceae bacterium]
MARPFDLVIIGLGAAGLTAARLAGKELGLRVAAVERSAVGGDCLWTGCVPSKSLIASARAIADARRAGEVGINIPSSEVDTSQVWRRLAQVRAEIATAETDAEHVRDWGVELFVGRATVTGPRRVVVSGDQGDTEIETRFILIATGSRPSMPTVPGLSEVPHVTNETIFGLEQPPESMTIIGAGPVGVETAQALQRLGIATTLIEAGPRVLANEEPELSDRLLTILREEGVTVKLGTAVTGAHVADDDQIILETADGDLHAQHVMVAAGRSSDVVGLGLEKIGVVATSAGVSVDARSRTIVPNVYAVGDAAAGRPRLTSVATADAALAVRDMFLPGRSKATTLAPWCVFTEPELAHVGFTASEAAERFGDRAVQVHRLEVSRVTRARIDARRDGAIMLITARGRIVGGHILGPHAGEIINELALAIRFSLGLDEMAQVPHVYPTIASGLSQLVDEQRHNRFRRFRQIAKIGRITG